ncbi:hypothetical protein [Yimella sp. cx-51]|uniref:hypothetical protein n=1 Tax=Yimella sp. cx-51 TaxID=2770551 RepID=UPI00165DB9CA|nr:hypothetical protein [Yimella sp. cx-51]
MSRRSCAPTRRTLLLAALALPAAGCSVRLERDAPPIPGVPTADPPADAAVLQQTISRLRSLAVALDGAEPLAWTAPLRSLHSDQADVLTRLAASAGITVTQAASPTSTASPSSTQTPTSTTAASTGATSSSLKASGSTSTATSSPSPTLPPSAQWEVDEFTLARVQEVVGATARHRPALLAVLAGHRAGARLLGNPGPPAVTGLAGADAVTVLMAVRTAIHAGEVLVAKTAFKERSPLSSLLGVLYAERMRLGREAGSLASAEQLTYALPPGSDDPARAKEVMAPLLVACARATASTSARWTTPASATRGVQLWGDFTALAWQWGSEPDTFLGLKQ